MPPTPVPLRFRPMADVAHTTQRSLRTIQTWARKGRIDKLKLANGTVLVDLVAADALSKQTPRRNRAKTAA
ncbi:hypothetical protein ACQEU3_46865 [Spirillospora sp. CA-253888]